MLLPADKPAWVSFTLEDSTAACLRDKQPLTAALQQLQGHANLAAVLVNCCAPAAVTAALPVLKRHAPAGEVAWMGVSAGSDVPTREVSAARWSWRCLPLKAGLVT